jgi:hypothetical protein
MKFQIPAANEPVATDYLRKLDKIDRLAESLDARFRLPLTNVRFGWDPLIGIIPIAGDLVALAPVGEDHRHSADVRRTGAYRSPDGL